MNPHLKYQTAQSWAWTRIDMLLLVYEQAVTVMNDGAKAIEQERMKEFQALQFKAMRTLLAIADGLDLERGELPVRVLQLVVYAIDQVRTTSSTAWRDAARVINTLREGFVEIQDEARNAEYTGLIPTLDTVG